MSYSIALWQYRVACINIYDKEKIYPFNSKCIHFFEFFFLNNIASAEPILFNNLTIVVSSCDKYEEFWLPFFTFLFKSWPSLKENNKHVPIFLMTNGKEYPDQRVQTIKTGINDSWSQNMADLLKKVQTKYILFLQEDYIIYQPVKESKLKSIMEIMKQDRPAYIELGYDSFFVNEPAHPNHSGIAVKQRSISRYRTALQASLWEKSVFQTLLNIAENPWEFEIKGSLRSQRIQQEFWVLQSDHPIIYFNACYRGKWVSQVFEYIKAEGVDIPVRRMPLNKLHYYSRWVERNFPDFYRKIIKFSPSVFKKLTISAEPIGNPTNKAMIY